jgi:hypothetical protein
LCPYIQNYIIIFLVLFIDRMVTNCLYLTNDIITYLLSNLNEILDSEITQYTQVDKYAFIQSEFFKKHKRMTEISIKQAFENI